MVTLLYHRSFAVIPLLRGNNDALDQSYLRNLSAYIVIPVILFNIVKLSMNIIYDFEGSRRGNCENIADHFSFFTLLDWACRFRQRFFSASHAFVGMECVTAHCKVFM